MEMSEYGDLNIGILINVHGSSDKGLCSKTPSIWSLLAPLQIQYTIGKINADIKILPNLTLGFKVVDTCDQLNGAVSRLIEFLPQACPQIREDENYVGLLGPGSSSSAVPAAALGSQYELPLLSTYATSEELSNKVRFKYFSRLVPPDSVVAEAISQLLEDSKWSFIQLLYSEGSYGENAAKSIEKNTKAKGICIGFKYRFSSDMTDDYSYIARKVLENRKAKVIVLIAFGSHVRKFISALSKSKRPERFIFIASDSFSPISGYEDQFQGSIQFYFKYGLDPVFHNYVNSLKPSDANHYWIEKLWELTGNCNFTTTCQNISKFSEVGSAFSLTNYVITAKYGDGLEVYAKALHDLVISKCPLAFQHKSILKVIDQF
ncbi:DgyrCDS18 [Dimorphilus gyrociliatus]|uniref:DgyrCDS18 n=1 Tax=Dimorphilus gyrociliatus TaxID=2664684 RepID=A0A7I8V7P4_9ANNE|nr:DgyrCDS18 [Dimorphilus gyrociliatus]